MLTKKFLVGLCLSAAISPFAMAKKGQEAWTTDPNHTSVSFDIGHLGISKIRGSFTVLSGNIKADPNDLANTELDIKVDTKSLNTGVPMRDSHVKSDDFLSADKFPEMTFKSTTVREDKANNKLFIDGDLTIKGKTKRVTFTANPISEEVRQAKDGAEKVIRATTATTTINRYDFGIDYGKAGQSVAKAKIADGGVGKDVEITIHTEFFKMVDNNATTTSKK